MQLEKTRYWHVISALDSSTSVWVAPLLPSLLSCHSYTELKAMLLDMYGQSDDQRARIFTDLSNRLPPEAMDKMLHLHGTEEPNFILRFTFKVLLLQPVRHALSTFPAISLHAWACKVDWLMADHAEGHDMPLSSCPSGTLFLPFNRPPPLHCHLRRMQMKYQSWQQAISSKDSGDT